MNSCLDKILRPFWDITWPFSYYTLQVTMILKWSKGTFNYDYDDSYDDNDEYLYKSFQQELFTEWFTYKSING